MSAEKKPEGIPLSALVKGNSRRNAEFAVEDQRTGPKLVRALAKELRLERERERIAEEQHVAEAHRARDEIQAKAAPWLNHKGKGRPRKPNRKTIELHALIRALKKKYPRTPRTKLYDKYVDVMITGPKMTRTTFNSHERKVERALSQKK